MPALNYANAKAINQLVTVAAVEQIQRERDWTWKRLASILKVNRRSGEITYRNSNFGMGHSARSALGRKFEVAAGGERHVADFGRESFQFRTVAEGLAIQIPIRDIEEDREIFADSDLIYEHGLNFMEMAYLAMEELLIGIVQNNSTLGAVFPTSAATVAWNGVGGTFFTDIKAQCRAIKIATGKPRRSLSLAISEEDADALSSSDDFKAALHGINEAKEQPTSAVLDAAAAQVGIKEIIILGEAGNTAVDGLDPVPGYVAETGKAWLGYVGQPQNDKYAAVTLIEKLEPYVGNHRNGEQGHAEAEKVFVDYEYGVNVPIQAGASTSNRGVLFTGITA